MNTLKGHRTKFTNPKLSPAQKDYLKRQSADPYVQAAHAAGYRSRAAFKLLEILEKENFLKANQVVVDLGCAPGGWCQVAANRVGHGGVVVGIDLLETDPIGDVILIQDDFTTEDGERAVMAALKGRTIDVVLSDMAANTVGHKETDGLRTMALVELAEAFALEHLPKGGIFLSKLFMNGEERELMNRIRPHFEKARFIKPDASRKDSRETYLLATGRK
ncbi:MAG: RlmE family RNA methyltransferase [Alphaproteobacteria bacterium]